MKMITPPECQGQIVEVSYGGDYSGVLYRRVVDRSDGSESWACTDADDCGCDGECDCFDPANREPEGFAWVPCEAPRD